MCRRSPNCFRAFIRAGGSASWRLPIRHGRSPTKITGDRRSGQVANVAKRYRDLSVQPAGITPDEMSKFVREETERWRKVIATSGIKPD